MTGNAAAAPAESSATTIGHEGFTTKAHGGAKVWTQRDQIQAYQFLRRRLVSALVKADADHPTPPSRRLILGTIIGVAAAVLITAVFGIIGVLNPSASANWRQGGQVIVEQETGARFVYGQDGLLHPVLNYASARLLAGGDGNQTASVPRKSLAAASRGAMLGIPGAPDSLPTAGNLLPATFASCTRSPADLPAAAEPVSTVVLGGPDPNGQTLATGAGLLVALRSGQGYLITDGHRYRLPDQASLGALGYRTQSAFAVSTNWLATVPAGRDLGLVAVPGVGAAGPTVGGAATRVGQVLSANGDYLVRRTGLVPITPIEAALVLDNNADAPAYPDGRPRVLAVSAAAAANAPIAQSATDDTGYPRTLPVLASQSQGAVLCAVGDGQDDTRIMAEPALPLPNGAKPMPVTNRTDDRVAAEVYVPPGTGALVRELVGAGGTTPTTYLITDAGMKYPVPSADALKALGYGAATAQPVAGTLLALLPTGPSLDPAAARQEVASR
ncbi:MAG TPA: type VII secretion protein EccB [Pseudonocardiaceae bacterium]